MHVLIYTCVCVCQGNPMLCLSIIHSVYRLTRDLHRARLAFFHAFRVKKLRQQLEWQRNNTSRTFLDAFMAESSIQEGSGTPISPETL